MLAKSKPKAKSTRASRTTSARSQSARNRSRTTGVSRSAKATVDHEEIQRWAEARGAVPACVRGTGRKGDTGMVRLDFPTGPERSLQKIGWDEWFQKFEDKELAMIYQDRTATGRRSRFNKIVSRDTVRDRIASRRGARTRTASS